MQQFINKGIAQFYCKLYNVVPFFGEYCRYINIKSEYKREDDRKTKNSEFFVEKKKEKKACL